MNMIDYRKVLVVLGTFALLAGGCGVVEPDMIGVLQEDFGDAREVRKITELLTQGEVDSNDPGSVESYVDELLSGVGIEYDLRVSAVTTAVQNRAFSTGHKAIRQKVEVLSFRGHGIRAGQDSGYTGSLFLFGTGEVWITLAWPDIELWDDGAVRTEGYRIPLESHSPWSKMEHDTPTATIRCDCDQPGGSVNGAACTDPQCEDLVTCEIKKNDGGTLKGSCALVGMF